MGITRTINTKYSDHKAFIIKIHVNTEIKPIKGNMRYITDINNRQIKNLLLIENLTNTKANKTKLNIIEDYNNNL